MWRMRVTCWIPKYTNTHSEYAILIGCPLQQCSHERPSMLPYSYIASLVTVETEYVCWAVRTDSLAVVQVDLRRLKKPYHGSGN